jgi:type IX secretion system PorP/SprF family membrane protein
MIKNSKYLLIIIVPLLNVVKGQDLHFSQFKENPSILNPALTGAFDNVRASVGYRSQWNSFTNGFVGYGASVETRFKSNNWEKVDAFRSMTFKEKTTNRLAMGASVYSDKSGDGQYGITVGNLSLASSVPLNIYSKLSVGVQGSFVQKSINTNKLKFPNQFDGLNYNTNNLSNENFANTQVIYCELATGMLYTFSDNKKEQSKSGNLGISAYHLNKPSANFLNSGVEKIQPRYTLHGEFNLPIAGSNLSINPSFISQMQGKLFEVIVGSHFKYYSGQNSKYTGIKQKSFVEFGTHYRINDALIFSIGLNKDNFGIGFSYDVNFSKLTTASNYEGASEVQLKYTLKKSYLYQKKTML